MPVSFLFRCQSIVVEALQPCLPPTMTIMAIAATLDAEGAGQDILIPLSTRSARHFKAPSIIGALDEFLGFTVLVVILVRHSKRVARIESFVACVAIDLLASRTSETDRAGAHKRSGFRFRSCGIRSCRCRLHLRLSIYACPAIQAEVRVAWVHGSSCCCCSGAK